MNFMVAKIKVQFFLWRFIIYMSIYFINLSKDLSINVLVRLQRHGFTFKEIWFYLYRFLLFMRLWSINLMLIDMLVRLQKTGMCIFIIYVSKGFTISLSILYFSPQFLFSINLLFLFIHNWFFSITLFVQLSIFHIFV